MKRVLSSDALRSAIRSRELIDNVYAIESAKHGTKYGHRDFERIIHQWYLLPRISIRGICTPEIISFDILSNTILDDPNPYHRVLGLAYCLGRGDIPVYLIEAGLRDSDSHCQKMAYYLCETSDISDETIYNWSTSLNERFRIAVFHAFLNKPTVDVGILENNPSFFFELPSDMRKELIKKVVFSEDLASDWLSSSNPELNLLGALLVSCNPTASLELIEQMISNNDKNIRHEAYRVLSQRDDVPQWKIDEWSIGDEPHRAAALASCVMQHNASAQMIEEGIISNFRPSNYYAVKASNSSVPREKILEWIRIDESNPKASSFISAGLMACIANPRIEYEIPLAHMNDTLIQRSVALTELCSLAYESLSGKRLRMVELDKGTYSKAKNGVTCILSIPSDAEVRKISNDTFIASKATITDIIGDYYGDKIAIFANNRFYGIGDTIEYAGFGETLIDGGKAGIEFFIASPNELSSILAS